MRRRKSEDSLFEFFIKSKSLVMKVARLLLFNTCISFKRHFERFLLIPQKLNLNFSLFSSSSNPISNFHKL